MSEMEGWIGKAYPIELGEDLDELSAMRKVLDAYGKDYDQNDDFDIRDEFYDMEEYQWVNGQMYKLVATCFGPYGHQEATKNPDGSYSFFAYYYNSTCLSEVLSEVFK